MTEQGPEPTGWELLRAINRIERAVESGLSRAVQLDAYAADQRGVDERFQRAEARLRTVEQAQKDEKTAEQDATRLKRSQQLTITLAIASPVLSFLLLLVGRWIP